MQTACHLVFCVPSASHAFPLTFFSFFSSRSQLLFGSSTLVGQRSGRKIQKGASAHLSAPAGFYYQQFSRACIVQRLVIFNVVGYEYSSHCTRRRTTAAFPMLSLPDRLSAVLEYGRGIRSQRKSGPGCNATCKKCDRPGVSAGQLWWKSRRYAETTAHGHRAVLGLARVFVQ